MPKCPRCQAKLTDEEIRKLWASRNSERSPKTGRPKSKAPRCPCGKMTLKCAKVRCHHCDVAQESKKRN